MGKQVLFFNAVHYTCNILNIGLIVSSNGYFVGPDTMFIRDAEPYCLSKGSNLATISNSADLANAQNTCQQSGATRGCAVGLYRDDTGEPWKWRDGSEIDYGFINKDPLRPATGTGPWYTNQPNNWEQDQDCTELIRVFGYKINDAQCADNRFNLQPLCNDCSDGYECM